MLDESTHLIPFAHTMSNSFTFNPIIIGILLPQKSKNIYLIGMPGAGKSYWAEQIAAQYGLQCIDLDSIIEVRTNMRIGNFFERYGEAEFRKLEQLTLKQVMEVFKSHTVVACGGGTPCFYDNLAQMKASGVVVYLQSSLSHLFQNLNQEVQTRPLLQMPDWQEKLSEMLDNRRSIFEQAHFTLNVSSLTVADFKVIMSAKQ